jgi:hypothetical protein
MMKKERVSTFKENKKIREKRPNKSFKTTTINDTSRKEKEYDSYQTDTSREFIIILCVCMV